MRETSLKIDRFLLLILLFVKSIAMTRHFHQMQDLKLAVSQTSIYKLRLRIDGEVRPARWDRCRSSEHHASPYGRGVHAKHFSLQRNESVRAPGCAPLSRISVSCYSGLSSCLSAIFALASESLRERRRTGERSLSRSVCREAIM